MTPLEINKLNEKMLDENSYRDKDSRIMTKVSMLKEKNDYDIYLMICTLCNYNIPEKSELIKMRMDYYNIVKDSDVDYSHTEDEYIIDKSKLKTICKNTGNINKYGLYEYEINLNNNNLVSSLWGYKTSDCLKFVDSKTYTDKLIVSIRKEQFDNFIKALDELMIGYDLTDLKEGVFHDNNSNNKLVDITKLSLPFTPYDYQLEDANKIVAMKRALLAHDMGCISGDAIVKIKVNDSDITTITLADLYNKQPNNAKIESYEDNKFKFIPINAILDKGKKQVLNIITSNTNIKCTYDHEILTTTGWVSASNLNVGNIIISNTNKTEQIINIEYLDEEINVYDVAIDSFITSNFVANGLVVHNCGKTFISVLVGTSLGENTTIIYNTLDNLNYNDIVITDKGPLPIGKIVEENIDCKVQVTKNGKIKFVNILDRSCTTE